MRQAAAGDVSGLFTVRSGGGIVLPMWLERRSVFQYPYAAVVALGMFDGVHLGHEALLKHCRQAARAQHLHALAYAFSTHPQALLGKAPQMLSTPGEKAVRMAQLGMDAVLMPPFTREIARMQAADFITLLQQRVPVRRVVIGFNHRFGAGRKGDAEMLARMGRSLGFTVDVLEPVQMQGKPVSSTRVRQALSQGDAALAARLLGRDYSVAGRVENGKRLASKLGFPTANITVPALKQIPLCGIYASRIRVAGQWLDAVSNVGVNPTTDPMDSPVRIETHIPGFVGDIYGQWVRVDFVRRLRDEIRFDSLDQLRSQVMRDIRAAQAVHRSPGPKHR